MNNSGKSWQSLIRHELNNAINTIIGYSSLLLDDFQYEQEEDLTWIVAEIEQIKAYGEQLSCQVKMTLPYNGAEIECNPKIILETRITLAFALFSSVYAIQRIASQVSEGIPPDFVADLQKIASSAQRIVNLINNLSLFLESEILSLKV
ncbi:hypothetical protein K4A83_08555 [Spirulina subsalsa FACHB-351]|uniref:histidine kinase n=1 Tax=Spirulina subsalsa FACHB-351 TaxID=234711 RepID=A0ABT3L491_9CYAN|nr:hypothetical protein [Spirulina subsalsa]MCW6036322.1 hypothetical protein [Spirulina subsalsa FACHB-351]